MHVLVMYESIEGQTKKIAETIASWLEDADFKVMLTSAGQVGYSDPGQFDGAILCAPIHMANYPDAFVDYITDWKEALEQIPTALVTVSLGIASKFPDEREEAAIFPSQLQNDTGWKAGMEHNAAGALKFLEYDFFKRWMMRRISEKEGGPVDTSKDHELTDWVALKKFVTDFSKSLTGSV
jgi:menaquinone-dependent protoporphyrinogen oxidase